MADRHSKIYGTEADRSNCPFFLKIGACRHGERCGRAHTVPTVSTTVLLRNMYANPKQQILASGGNPDQVNDAEHQDHFEATYEDVWEEVTKYGEVEEMMIADNLPDHLVGNVWVRFFREEDALKCLQALSGRYYAGKLISAGFTSATDFGDARCRHKDTGRGCHKGWNCNFVHAKRADPRLLRALDEEQPSYGDNTRSGPVEYDHDRKYGGRGGGGGGFARGGAGGGGYAGGPSRGGGDGLASAGFGGSGYSRGGNAGSYSRGGEAGGFSRGGDTGGYSRGGDTGGYSRGGDTGGFSRGGGTGGYSRGGDTGGFSRGGDTGGYSRPPPPVAAATVSTGSASAGAGFSARPLPPAGGYSRGAGGSFSRGGAPPPSAGGYSSSSAGGGYGSSGYSRRY